MHEITYSHLYYKLENEIRKGNVGISSTNVLKSKVQLFENFVYLIIDLDWNFSIIRFILITNIVLLIKKKKTKLIEFSIFLKKVIYFSLFLAFEFRKDKLKFWFDTEIKVIHSTISIMIKYYNFHLENWNEKYFHAIEILCNHKNGV